MWHMRQEGRQVMGGGGGRVRTQHGHAHLLQPGGEVRTTTHIILDGTGGAPRGRSIEEAHISTGKDTVDDSTSDGKTTARGGSGVCYTQREGRHDAAANGGTRVLDIPGNMAFSR